MRACHPSTDTIIRSRHRWLCCAIQRMALDTVVYPLHCNCSVCVRPSYERNVQEGHLEETRSKAQDCAASSCANEGLGILEDHADHHCLPPSTHAVHRTDRLPTQSLHGVHVQRAIRLLRRLPLYLHHSLWLQHLAVWPHVFGHWLGCSPSGCNSARDRSHRLHGQVQASAEGRPHNGCT